MNAPHSSTARAPHDHRSQVDDTGHVGVDVACVACGYNIHTLAADARCPECNLPIEVTLRATNDAAWLANVKSGIQSMLVGHYFILVSLLVWPFSLIGFCLAMLLQVGSAIDLAARHPDDFTPRARNHWLMLLITVGAVGYAVGGVMMVVGFAGGPPLVLLAASLHAGGITIAWSRFEAVMRRGISLQLATAARSLKCLTAALAALLAGPSADAWIMRSAASGPGLDPQVLLILCALAMLWLLASLVVLHMSIRATRRQLVSLPSGAQDAQ